MANKVCNCVDWKSSADQIFGTQSLAWTHGIKYTGKIWVYCPWCKKKLKDEEPKPEKDTAI